MQTLSIVPNLDKLKDGTASFCVRCEMPAGTLGLERAEEALSHGIVDADNRLPRANNSTGVMERGYGRPKAFDAIIFSGV